MFDKKKKKKILVVEDDALLSQVLNKSLIEEGFEVLIIENGLKAFDATKKFKPDIVLLDLILQGLDGFAVLKKLKSEKSTKKIPVVIISNLSAVSDVKSAQVLGAEMYFIKSNTQLEKIIKFVKSRLHG